MNQSSRRPYFVLAAVLLVLDQLTKVMAHAWLRGSTPVELIPGFFNLIYSRNRGGLFGYFGDLAEVWRIGLLTIVPLGAVVLIGFVLARGEADDRPTLLGLGLILGGAAGNLIDRIFRGEVVDFLDVYVSSPGAAAWLIETFGTAHWPTFNVADSGIVVGAGLLILTIFRRDE